MVRNRVGFLFLTGLFFALGALVACGGSAEPAATSVALSRRDSPKPELT